MRESANYCENRLLSYRGAVNAPLGTTLSFPPMFGTRSAKTGGFYAMATQADVKTETGFRINIRWGHLDRLPKCKHGRVFCRECGL